MEIRLGMGPVFGPKYIRRKIPGIAGENQV